MRAFAVLINVQNIVLSGGSTLFKDFGKRLQRDIKRSVDERINMVQDYNQATIQAESQKIRARQVDVNVISHKRQRYAVWFGGSLLADTVFTCVCVRRGNMCVSRRISTATAIQRRSTRSMGRRLHGTTRCLDQCCNNKNGDSRRVCHEAWIQRRSKDIYCAAAAAAGSSRLL